MFKNMKLGQKMVLGFAAILAIAVMMGLVGYNGLTELMKETDDIGAVRLPSVDSLLEISEAQTAIEVSYIGLSNRRFSKEMRQKLYEKHEAALTRVDEALKIYEPLPQSKREAELWKKFVPLWDTWKEHAEEMIKMAQEKDKLIAAGVDEQDKRITDNDNEYLQDLEEIDSQFVKSEALLVEVVKENAALAAEGVKKADDAFSNSVRLLVISMIIGALIAIFLSFFISSNVSGILKSLIDESSKLTEAAVEGRLATRADVSKVDPEFQPIVVGVNKTLDAVIGPLNVAAEYIDRISKGDIPPKISDTYKGDFNEIKNNVNVCIDSLNTLINEMKHMSREHDAGDIDVQVDASKLEGAYKEMGTGINTMVFGHIAVKKKAMACVAEFGKGNFDAPLERFPGKKAFINETIEAVRGNLKAIAAEVLTLIEASKEGNLTKRGNFNAYAGDWRKLVLGLNEILDAILIPINEAAEVLKEMSKGNMDTGVLGAYKGDHALIKNSLNATLDAINDILSQVSIAVDQVSSGANQVSSSSQTLSQASSESASSLEEITSSMEEFTSQTKQNAENATQANQLAGAAKVSAGKGNEQMTEMLAAMKEIKDSATNVSKIMKAIDEIAFQTNILALNAAVEAARAGRHGKGFTVVAEEVRNLAQRSAKAASETADLIENSISKTNGGSKIAEETSKSLSEIVVSATKVTDLIGEIAAASKEQTGGIGEINQGLSQLEQVTQQNSATSEESAAASEELSSQAVHLKNMISRFKLRQMAGQMGMQGAMAQQGAVMSNFSAHQAMAKIPTVARNPKRNDGKGRLDKNINLDDKDFDKF